MRRLTNGIVYLVVTAVFSALIADWLWPGSVENCAREIKEFILTLFSRLGIVVS